VSAQDASLAAFSPLHFLRFRGRGSGRKYCRGEAVLDADSFWMQIAEKKQSARTFPDIPDGRVEPGTPQSVKTRRPASVFSAPNCDGRLSGLNLRVHLRIHHVKSSLACVLQFSSRTLPSGFGLFVGVMILKGCLEPARSGAGVKGRGVTI
jgi:hypothetical protein